MAKQPPRWEKFAQRYIEIGVASDAYRLTYPCAKWSKKTITEKACRLLGQANVQACIAALQRANAEQHKVTAGQLIEKLDEAFSLARTIIQPAPMVSAVMGMARITGLDKQIVEHRGAEINLVINRPKADGA